MELSPGDLADRLSILAIKKDYITDPKKLENVQREYAMMAPLVTHPIDELKDMNSVIWDVENEIRLHEKRGDFGQTFIRLARLVYHTNDRRAAIKRAINEGSLIAEEKQYTSYIQTNRPRLAILTHMGLGDHFICNGLIRHLAKTSDVVTYAKHGNVKNVREMFRDLGPDVTVIAVEGDNEAWDKLLTEPNALRTGLFVGPNWQVAKPWCVSFYVHANVNPSALRDEFFVLRSRDREEAFHRKVVDHLGTDKYIVIHDDPSRYQSISVATDLPIVRIGRGLFPVESDTIYDYCTLIERAQQYHGYDSSFAWIVELMRLRPKSSTFLHRYIREQISPGHEEFTQFCIISQPTLKV